MRLDKPGQQEVMEVKDHQERESPVMEEECLCWRERVVKCHHRRMVLEFEEPLDLNLQRKMRKEK